MCQLKRIWKLCLLLLIVSATQVEAASEELPRRMLDETNLARTQPHLYANYLRQMRAYFQGKVFTLPGSGSMVMTTEGVAALDEAIKYLSRQSPLPPLSWSRGLAEAAADLVLDEGRTGEIGHSGRSSGDMRHRIERHGSWSRRIAENIGYGPTTARLMVIELIIDDGVPERGHRKAIFNPALRVAGAACGAHPLYQNMCVMDFAYGFSKEKKKGEE
jgi:uncharacterized protein YkwD